MEMQLQCIAPKTTMGFICFHFINSLQVASVVTILAF